jgi:RNA polymerase sigma-70 factor (ECF subfamily)
MEKTDEELIDEYVQGHEEVLPLLIERHLSSVYSLARSLTNAHEEAEDIAQETFVKIWKNLGRYKKGNVFRSWLLTITRNTAYDYLRKKKNIAFSRFENEDGQNTFIDTLQSTEPEALEQLVAHDDAHMLRQVLETLSPAYREVLTLRYGEELTFDEIGKILDKSLNTVKSQHRRALIELRKKITSFGAQNDEKMHQNKAL